MHGRIAPGGSRALLLVFACLFAGLLVLFAFVLLRPKRFVRRIVRQGRVLEEPVIDDVLPRFHKELVPLAREWLRSWQEKAVNWDEWRNAVTLANVRVAAEMLDEPLDLLVQRRPLLIQASLFDYPEGAGDTFFDRIEAFGIGPDRTVDTLILSMRRGQDYLIVEQKRFLGGRYLGLEYGIPARVTLMPWHEVFDRAEWRSAGSYSYKLLVVEQLEGELVPPAAPLPEERDVEMYAATRDMRGYTSNFVPVARVKGRTTKMGPLDDGVHD